MNDLIKRFSVLLFFVAAPLNAEGVGAEGVGAEEAAENSAEQLSQKQEKIMQLEIELLELKLNNEKRKVKELEARVESEKNNQAEKTVAVEEKKKVDVIDEELQRKPSAEKAVKKPALASINDDFKIRFGASYLYANELTIKKGNAGIDFFEPYEGRMINEKTTEGSVEIQSPHLYFSSRSKVGILFSMGYQRFEFGRQEVDYIDNNNGTIVDLGTRAEGNLFYLMPIIFINPLRNISANHSLVMGFGFGLSRISAKGTTQLTEPSYLGDNGQTQYYNVSDTGAILKLMVDYQWKNIYLGLFAQTSFVQSSIIRNKEDDYIYTSSGVTAGISFNL